MPRQLGTGAFLQKSHGVRFSWNSSWVWKEKWPRGGQARRDSPLAAEPYDKVKSNFGAVSTTAGGTCQEARCCCWKTIFHKVWACDVHLSPMCGPGHGALLLDKIAKAGRGGNCVHAGGWLIKLRQTIGSGNPVLITSQHYQELELCTYLSPRALFIWKAT